MRTNKENGRLLFQLRRSKGLSKKELGELLNCSESTIQFYELGHRRPRDEVKVKYASVFNTTVQKLFYE